MPQNDVGEKWMKDSIDKAQKIQQCRTRYDRLEAEFLAKVNDLPDLARMIVGIDASKDRNGDYRYVNGKLAGNSIYGDDPGFVKTADHYFGQQKKIKCR